MNTDERRVAIKLAFGEHLRSSAALMEHWLGTLTPERAARVSEYDAMGMRIGLLTSGPELSLSCITRVVLVHAGNVVKVLDRIELDLDSGESLAVN